MTLSAPSLAEGARVGGYTIVGRLGAGGFGVVYEARDDSGNIHALKHLSGIGAVSPKNGPALLSRFRREARVCRELRHGGIVPVTDHGVEDGIPYLVIASSAVKTRTPR